MVSLKRKSAGARTAPSSKRQKRPNAALSGQKSKEPSPPGPPGPPGPGLPFPPEIRNLIYEYALTLSKPSRRATQPKKSKASTSGLGNSHPDLKGAGQFPDSKGLSLLLVSKQTYIEAFAFYYKLNTLHLPNLKLLTLFLRNIGFARRQYLTSLSFLWSGKDPTSCRTALTMLQKCPSLRTLKIFTVQNDKIEAERMKALRSLKAVKGLDKVSFIDHKGKEDIEVRDDLESYMTKARPARLLTKDMTFPYDLLNPKKEVFITWKV